VALLASWLMPDPRVHGFMRDGANDAPDSVK